MKVSANKREVSEQDTTEEFVVVDPAPSWEFREVLVGGTVLGLSEKSSRIDIKEGSQILAA